MKTRRLLKHYAASQILVAALCFGTGCTLLTALSVRAELSGSESQKSMPSACPMVLPPFEALENGCTYVQGKTDMGCTVFKKVCEKSSTWSSIRDCPVVQMPFVPDGCHPEKTMRDDCPSIKVVCDNGGSASSRPFCPMPAMDVFMPGCKMVKGDMGPDGCPIWKTVCEDKSSSASSRPFCPMPSMPVGPGCHMERGDEVNGCPTWKTVCDNASSRSSTSARSCPEPKSMDGLGYGCHVLREKSEGCDPVVFCIDPPFNPNSASQLSSKPGVVPMLRCPEMGNMPQPQAGCFSVKVPTDNGCMTWKTICQATQSSADTEYGDTPENEQYSSAAWQESSIPRAGFEEPVAPVDVPTEVQNWFHDVSTDDAVGQAANELADKGIVGGYSDGTFRPDQGVNRAEAAKFLVLAKVGDFPGDMRNNGKFRDVTDGEWYTKYVMAASILNIIGGNPDGTFRPGSPVNTAEFLKMLTLAFDLPLNLSYNYQDVANDDWFSAYAGVAQQYDLFPGRGGMLQPERALTRGEVVYAIAQVLNAR